MKKKHEILIVDDEAENLNLLAVLLGGKYNIRRAVSGAAALKILDKHQPHVILCDQRMPGMSGVELLEQARKRRPDAVRILMTAYPDAETAIEAINRGEVRRYVTKPFDPASLRDVIEQELERLDLMLANRSLNLDLGRMVRELEELHRTKDRFLADCSHELKTPLVSSMGYLDLMLSGGMGELEPRQEKGMRVAHRNLERLLGMIEGLLALTRARTRPMEIRASRFPLRPLVEECVASLRARSRKRSLKITVTWSTRAPVVMADERGVHSVLTNVLSNAEKFTPEDAEIKVGIKKGKKNRVVVTIADNGFGSIKPRKATPSRKGMGIGLALARQVLGAHGCELKLDSNRKGTVVKFDVPLASRKSAVRSRKG